MAVRLLSSMANTTHSWAPGEVREDLPEAEESRLVEMGLAEWLAPASPPAPEVPEKKKATRKEVR